ncbi:MAG: antiterminator LoaP [Treponema sp.]|jgi:transcriptional antiterminator NusG|nr:antiterminator LoaP [Treponema sp.]
MYYFAVQVKTRGEEKFIRHFRAFHPEVSFPMYFPKRTVNLRRRGRVYPTAAAIFPGYIFLEVDDEKELLKQQWTLRRTDGFYRFLRSNQNISPLGGRDLELVLHFIKKVGPLAGTSRVYFDENARIVVTDGPLMGLEGSIVKVDKRKGRAKIKLDLYDDSFSVDLAFEVIQSAVKAEGRAS